MAFLKKSCKVEVRHRKLFSEKLASNALSYLETKIVGHASWSSASGPRLIKWEIPNLGQTMNFQKIRSPDFTYDNTSHYLMLHTQRDTCSSDTYVIYLKLFNVNGQIPSNMLKAYLFVDSASLYTFVRMEKSDLYLALDLMKFTKVTIFMKYVQNRMQNAVEKFNMCAANAKRDQKLCLGHSPNFRDVYLKKLHTDYQINVGKRIFHVHKMVLAIRSSVFAAMLENNLMEKDTNTVNVTDCDPDSFHVFLLFLYSGETEELSMENALNVYFIADKYQVEELKTECVTFMKANVSVDKFCDIASLASKYNENELLKECQNYFKRNLKLILECEHWHLFLKEYTNLANDFLMLLAF